MKTAKHTPAPWKHKPRNRDGHVDIITDSRNREFIHVGCPAVEEPILDYPHENQQTADARLIAAAPELLEALQELMRCSVAQEKSELPDERSFWQSVGMARVAIAKAQGTEKLPAIGQAVETAGLRQQALAAIEAAQAATA